MKPKVVDRNQVPSAYALTSFTAGSINIRRRLIGLALIGSFLALATAPRVFGQGGSGNPPPGLPLTESDLVAQILATATGSTTPLTDGDYNATGVTGVMNGSVTTGCDYDPLTRNGKRILTDISVASSIGTRPLKMTRYYNTRSKEAHGGLGTGWAHEYDWYATGNGKVIHGPSGNTYDFSCGPPPGIPERWESGDWTNGRFRLGDGSTLVFSNFVVTTILDPHGQPTTIERDQTTGFISRVKEPGGRYLQYLYIVNQTTGKNLLNRVEAYDKLGGTMIDWVEYVYDSKSGGCNSPAQSVLTQVNYSDGTQANYTYVGDNAPCNYEGCVQCPPPLTYPLLGTADDTHYSGAMHQIAYVYDTTQNKITPHGAIRREKNLATTQIVSEISIPDAANRNRRTETRGDGPTRDFKYSDPGSTSNEPGSQCDAMPQFLKHYTDFEGHTTYIDYDFNWFINSVTDARGTGRGDQNYTTTYLRGSTIGEVRQITHPDGSFIRQTYTDDSKPYYLATRTDERGNTTWYSPASSPRDSNNRITRIEYPDGGYETFEYDEFGFGLVKKQRLRNGAYQHFLYDPRGLLTDKWNPTLHATPQADDPKTHFDYYTSGPWTDRVQTETDPLGRRTQYEYDYKFDINGNPTATPCAGHGLITKIIYPDDTHNGTLPNGTSKSFGYDKYGNKKWEKNELGHRTDYTYDDYNRVTSVKTPSPINGLTTYDYSPTQGNATLNYKHTTNSPYFVTDPMNIVTANTYDGDWRKKSTAVAGATTWFNYDAVGNPTKVTDPRGSGPGDNYTAFTTTTDYDARNRKWKVRDPQNHETTFYYDDNINLTRIVRPDGSTETKQPYDAMNRLLTDTVPKEGPPGAPTEFVITNFVYNPSGTLYSVEDGKSQITTFEYDPSDLKTKMIYPNGHYQQWTYDPAKNLIARRTVNNEAELFSYDERNRKIWMAWSNGVDWAYFDYDAAGRMISAENPSSTITRQYDEGGRLTLDRQRLRVVPVSAISRKTHGSAGTFDIALPLVGKPGVECRMGTGTQNNEHQIIVTFPRPITFTSAAITTGVGNIASTSTSADGKQVTINLSGVTNAQTIVVTLGGVNDGTITNDVKVGMGVVLGDVNDNGLVNSTDVSLTQSQSGQAVTTSNFRQDVNLNGLINSTDVSQVQAKSGTGVSPSSLIQPVPTSPDINVQYSYDPAGKEEHLYATNSNGSATGYDYTFSYDGLGRFEKINSGGTLFQYSYDLASNETHRLRNLNSVDQDYGSPDSLNRKPKRDVTKNGALIAGSREVYGYEQNRPGLLTSVERDDNKSDIFHYDLLPELDWAHYGVPTGGGAAQREVGYEWDKAGNREGVSDNGAYTNYTPVGNQLNQYLQVGIDTVTNGNEHEIAVYQNINYTYINDTRLSLVSGPDLLGQQTNYQLNYDALGRTVVRILNGVPTYYIYDGEKPILEYQGGWTQPLASNVYGKGIDEILMRTDYSLPTEQRPYYYQSDHEGSITHLIDTNGNVLETYRYDAFGKPTINGGALTASALNNRFMFTGREYVPQFGIYEYRARAYHPGLGRFMSEDPKLFDAGDYNLFRYCHNDPLDLTDPMGLLAGFDRYRLVYDPRQQHDATHDGWSVQGVPGTESKSGGVHLEVDRSVTRSERIANSDKGGDTKSSFTADKKGGEATIHLQIDVRYATKAGDFTRAKAESSEWQHSTDAVNEGNRIRGLYAGRVGGLSAEAAVALIRNGDRRGPMSTWTAPLKGPFGYETKLFRESYNRWDSLDAARMRGEKVAPHTPVDPVTGEPVPWNR